MLLPLLLKLVLLRLLALLLTLLLRLLLLLLLALLRLLLTAALLLLRSLELLVVLQLNRRQLLHLRRHHLQSRIWDPLPFQLLHLPITFERHNVNLLTGRGDRFPQGVGDLSRVPFRPLRPLG